MTRNDPPQTVGEAISFGWHWVQLKCVICRHQGWIRFIQHSNDARLAHLISRSTCTRCGSKQVNAALVMEMTHSQHIKDIAVMGNSIVKASMHWNEYAVKWPVTMLKLSRRTDKENYWWIYSGRGIIGEAWFNPRHNIYNFHLKVSPHPFKPDFVGRVFSDMEELKTGIRGDVLTWLKFIDAKPSE
jgi:hypothetical protein